MGRRICVAAAVAATATAATVAEAAVKSGTYKGDIKGAGSITLKIDSQKRLVKFVRTKITVKCDDGSTAFSSKITTTGFAPIKSDGTFVWKASPDDVANTGDSWRLSGTVKSPRASGTLTEKPRFNSAGEPDPNGSVRCSSGKLKWTAKRQ